VEDDTKGESEIVQVLQKGYKIGDKVIRFAMVSVAN
jgi:molecular chaperone GrpE